MTRAHPARCMCSSCNLGRVDAFTRTLPGGPSNSEVLAGLLSLEGRRLSSEQVEALAAVLTGLAVLGIDPAAEWRPPCR